jgi:dTDP-4-amino-4,6-dideoxygalactose transaminase
MMVKFLDLNAQYQALKPQMDAAIADVIANSRYIGGAGNQAFETAFAAYQQAGYCIGVGNGTDSLEIALEALGLAPGAEVIVPANTFIASSEAVTRSGLRVVFTDVDPVTYTLDIADVRRRLTPKTGAIMAVHLYGHPCDMDGLLDLAKAHGLKIIEDCAQAHGAEYRGRKVGAIGDIGSFSFYPGKNLGAYGDGGALTTNDEALAKRCRMIANHGRTGKYDHEFEGRNSRLDGLQAAVLNVKLPHLESWIVHRNRLAEAYLEQLRGINGLILPVLPREGRHGLHLFVVRTERRDALKTWLGERGIETGVHYPIALPKLAAYAYLGQQSEPMFANMADKTLLSLPIGDHMTEVDVATVTAAIKLFFQQA